MEAILMKWLCVEARFLFGKYHGSRSGGRRRDYPPSPHRMFQALVAAANSRGGMDQAAKEALLWLEGQPPPQISVPKASMGTQVNTFVPNNDMNVVASAWAKGEKPEKTPEQLKTKKILQPLYLDGDSTVRFLWPVQENTTELEHICIIARHIRHLGLGIDIVVGGGRVVNDSDKNHLSGDNYIPVRGKGWRVPVEGTLVETLQRYADKIVATPPTVFGEVAYVREAATRPPKLNAFALVDEDGAYSRFDATNAMVVAAELRHVAHVRAKQLKFDAAFTEGYVCGHANGIHDKNDRFAYVPVPTLAPAGRDNDIRRVLLIQGRERSEADSLALRLGGSSLSGKAWLRPIDNLDNDGVIRKYTQAAERWATVTPIVLPGHLNGRGLERRQTKLVLKSLAHAGIMTPVSEVSLQLEPIFPGGERASRYRVPEYLQQFTKTHAVITFSEPVIGPLVIGAGRYVGLGLMAGYDWRT
jgi:CRISPR-associated protein Csb2